jgi:hypothetical protein
VGKVYDGRVGWGRQVRGSRLRVDRDGHVGWGRGRGDEFDTLVSSCSRLEVKGRS